MPELNEHTQTYQAIITEPQIYVACLVAYQGLSYHNNGESRLDASRLTLARGITRQE